MPLAKALPECPVVALKAVRVSDYDGRSLSVSTSTQIEIDPDLPRAETLRQWFASDGNTVTPRMISVSTVSGGGADPAPRPGSTNVQVSSMSELNKMIEDKSSGASVAEYVEVKAKVAFIKRENSYYPKCPEESCNSKVVSNGENEWRCDRCDQTFPTKTNRYVLQASLQDDSATTWVTVFGDQAQMLMGTVTADEVEKLQETDLDKFDAAFQATQDKWFKFVLRLKTDEYQEQVRTKAIVVRIELTSEPEEPPEPGKQQQQQQDGGEASNTKSGGGGGGL
uniref:Replication factor A C-terminal domain-containing protein n=1 Tax=Lotharella oceanica TaxID=641309 RepID=A0A7S2XF33_9EUKA|mmetsp:Transcript_37082/g.68463  ORF Transcript_37082/g.68463 Transcript_37082/m.68463 type:complete len:281 (+) Transcript_37082:91-933(+)